MWSKKIKCDRESQLCHCGGCQTIGKSIFDIRKIKCDKEGQRDPSFRPRAGQEMPIRFIPIRHIFICKFANAFACVLITTFKCWECSILYHEEWALSIAGINYAGLRLMQRSQMPSKVSSSHQNIGHRETRNAYWMLGFGEKYWGCRKLRYLLCVFFRFQKSFIC